MKQAVEAAGATRTLGAAGEPLRQQGLGDRSGLDLRERFEAALSRAAPMPVAMPVDAEAKDPAATRGLPERDVVLRRRGIGDELDDAVSDHGSVPPALPGAMAHTAALPNLVPVTGAAGQAPAVDSMPPVSATAAAAQRLQATPVPEGSTPWRIHFGGHETAASGLAALVVTPSAQGAAQWRVIASAAMQAVLSGRTEGLRARLAERGVKGGVIAVSDKEGDDESQG